MGLATDAMIGRVGGYITASSLAATSPNVSFTVPAGMIFRGTFSGYGITSSGTPLMQVLKGGVGHLVIGVGYHQTVSTIMGFSFNLELEAGSYTTTNVGGAYSAGTANWYVTGFLYKRA